MRSTSETLKMIEEDVTFKTSRGLKLSGALLAPDWARPPFPVAPYSRFVAGFGCFRESFSITPLSRRNKFSGIH